VTPQQASWVASLSLLGALFGGALAGVALRCGRRRVLLVCAVPFSASWLLTVFATSVEMMFATAFAGGFCCALVLLVTQVSPHSFAPHVLRVPHSLPLRGLIIFSTISRQIEQWLIPHKTCSVATFGMQVWGGNYAFLAFQLFSPAQTNLFLRRINTKHLFLGIRQRNRVT
jgi:MFS family permease